MKHIRTFFKDGRERITPLILAGGLGKRLRSAVTDRPKVLAPVCGRPFISYLLDQLIATGLRQVILSTEYKGDQVREAFGDEYKDLTIHYSQEPEALGTGGAVRYGLPLVTTEAVLVMNGDSYVDADINSYLAWYFEKDHQSSLLLTKVTDTRRYGRVEMDEEGRITYFEEKCKGRQSNQGWINAGVYIMKKHLLESIPFGKHFSLERQFLPYLVGKGLFGFKTGGAFIDIGTPESYARAERFFAEICE